jgi:hypothetical protein
MLFAAVFFLVTYLFRNGGFVSIGPWRGTPDPRDRMYAHNMVWSFLSAMSLSQTDPSSEQGAGRKKTERNL